MNETLTTQEAADILGFRRTSVVTLIHRKRLPATKHGRDWLIRREDVEEYQRKRQPPGRPPTHKTCARCRNEKPLDAFSPFKRNRDGRMSWCRECHNTYKHEKRQHEYAEQERAYRRAYYAANRDSRREQAVRWQRQNKERKRETYRQWCQTPQGRAAQRNGYAKRRALLQQSGSDLTTQQIADLMERQKRCAYCKCPFTKQRRPTIDHVIPLSKGGPHTLSNVVLACNSCNSGKRDKLLYLL